MISDPGFLDDRFSCLTNPGSPFRISMIEQMTRNARAIECLYPSGESIAHAACGRSALDLVYALPWSEPLPEAQINFIGIRLVLDASVPDDCIDLVRCDGKRQRFRLRDGTFKEERCP